MNIEKRRSCVNVLGAYFTVLADVWCYMALCSKVICANASVCDMC